MLQRHQHQPQGIIVFQPERIPHPVKLLPIRIGRLPTEQLGYYCPSPEIVKSAHRPCFITSGEQRGTEFYAGQAILSAATPSAEYLFRALTLDYFQYGIFAQVQLPADLAVGLAGGHQRQHLRCQLV